MQVPSYCQGIEDRSEQFNFAHLCVYMYVCILCMYV